MFTGKNGVNRHSIPNQQLQTNGVNRHVFNSKIIVGRHSRIAQHALCLNADDFDIGRLIGALHIKYFAVYSH